MAAEAQIIFKAEARQAQQSIQTLRGQVAQLNKTLAEQRTQLLTADAAEQKKIRTEIAANVAAKATLRSRIEVLTLQKQSIVQTQREAQETQRAAAQQARAAAQKAKAREQAAKAQEVAAQREARAAEKAAREREQAAQRQIRAEQQKAKATERAAQEQIRAQRRMSSGQQALVQELTMGVRVIHQQLSQLTGGFVTAAADMETFRNTIHVVTQDTDETNRILAKLLQLTVDLVGIDTSDLISYAGRLMATGLSAEEAITAISGVTKRIAEQGRSAAETRMVMEQVVQSFNTGRAVMFDFRTLMRLMPTLWDDATAALGTTVKSTEEFNRAADAAGGHTKALLAVLGEMDRASGGANMDTLNAQLEILQDLAGIVAAELGEHLIPAIVAVLKHVNRWLDEFRKMNDTVQAAIAWAAALATGLTGLATVVGIATVGFGALAASLSAMTGATGIAAVTAGIGGLAAGFAVLAPYLAVGGVIIGGLALLATQLNKTSGEVRGTITEIKRLDEVTKIYNVTTGQMQTLTAEQADAYQKFTQQTKDLRSRLEEGTQALQKNRQEQEALNFAIVKASGDAIPGLRKQLEGLKRDEETINSGLDSLTDKLQNLKLEIAPTTETSAVESLEEQLVRAVDQVLRLQDAFQEVSRGGNIQAIQAAASDLTAGLKRELDLQLKDAELTAAERLELELAHARDVEKVNRDVQKQIAALTEETANAREKAADARIKEAARVRAVEVKEFERAARSGKAYADQLRELSSLGARQDFQTLVDTFQEQGLSLEAAREKAGRYIHILNAVNLNSAEQQFGDFNSRLKRDTDESADAVYNLVQGVRALGAAIGELPDTAGSLERALENERRYFEQNPIGRTLDDVRDEAGQQGRDYVTRLFEKQDTAAEREATEAAREAARELTEMASVIDRVVGELSTFEGEVGSLATKIGQFDIAGLAAGNPLSIATLPFQLYNAFTFDQRQADARLPELDRQNREAYHRGEFGIPTDLLEFGRGAVERALGFTDDSQLRERLEQLSPEIGRTALDAVATLPDQIIETIQGFTDEVLEGLKANLDTAKHNLAFEKLTDDADGVQAALIEVIDANTALYQEQIDSYNLQRLATGRAVGNVEELNRILNDLNNDARLQLEGADITPAAIAARQQEARALAERTGTDRQFTEDIARQQYGAVAYDAEVEAAEAARGLEAAEAEQKRVFEKFHQFSATFVGGLSNIHTTFEEATAEIEANARKRAALPSTQYVPGRSQAETIAADAAWLEGLRERPPGYVNPVERELSLETSRFEEGLRTSLNRVLGSVLDETQQTLLSFSEFDPLEAFRLNDPARLGPTSLTNLIADRLPEVVQNINSGEILGGSAESAQRLAEVLRSTAESEAAGFERLDTTVTESVGNVNESVISLNDQTQTNLQSVSERVSEVRAGLSEVAQAVQELADRPVSVTVNMNSGSQVVELISEALAEQNVSNTRFT